MPRRYFHFFCVILLLIAQQGALAHAAWHASGSAQTLAAHDHESDANHESPADQSSQCAFDLAFGQMLGGVHASCALPLVVEITAAVAAAHQNPRLLSEAIPAQSRGPPQTL